MFNRTKNIFIFIILFTFFTFIIKYYFSEQNIILTNKSRTNYTLLLNQKIQNIPLLKNDTNNIIVYKDELKEFKNKRKKRFWENLMTNSNE